MKVEPTVIEEAVPDLVRRQDGRLILRKQEDGKAEEIPVHVACCFPWSRRMEYFSIRNDKGQEQTFVKRLDTLPDPVRKLLEEELVDRLFVPRICSIKAITEQAELFHWNVVTDCGPRGFLTVRGDHPRSLPGGRTLVKDISKDLYLIENTAALDARSRRLLWVYLD